MDDLLGAWALDVCDDTEAAAVQAHLDECPACAAEAGRLRAAATWLGAEQVTSPPAHLRQSVLDRARRTRAPSTLHTLIGAYARQVAALDRTLRDLTAGDWRRPDPRHGDLTGLIRHLTGNDARLAGDLQLPVVRMPTARVRDAWRTQADTLIQSLADDTDLEQGVTLAGRAGPSPGVLRDALVQRTFETWIHHEDVRGGLLAPPAEHVRRIVSLAVSLLPGAVAARGLARPGVGLLDLTGRAGGRWSLPFGDFVLRADATDFARLVANRRRPDHLDYTVEGDRRLAEQMLAVASTLGCD
ncbi:MAG: hypothetical protein HOV79_25245 [Hamadaea sp.]|nr:hypothetical protein [Hamadaea sp.]